MTCERPAASVIGALSSVLEDGALLDAVTEQKLLKTAQDEARRLNWLVQNLLDMTRLEGGAIRMKTQPCDVHDVVGAALRQLGEVAQSHPVSVTIAPNLPLVPMDSVLIVQVLVNVLDNALKYSPGETPVEIEAQADGDHLEIRVWIAGEGFQRTRSSACLTNFFAGLRREPLKGQALAFRFARDSWKLITAESSRRTGRKGERRWPSSYPLRQVNRRCGLRVRIDDRTLHVELEVKSLAKRV